MLAPSRTGGFVDEGEELGAAAARELEEETGLSAREAGLTQVGAFGEPGRDPRGWCVSVAYAALLPAQAEVLGADDAEEAQVGGERGGGCSPRGQTWAHLRARSDSPWLSVLPSCLQPVHPGVGPWRVMTVPETLSAFGTCIAHTLPHAAAAAVVACGRGARAAGLRPQAHPPLRFPAPGTPGRHARRPGRRPAGRRRAPGGPLAPGATLRGCRAPSGR